MLLKAKEKTWAPRHPILDKKSHQIVGWTWGRWLPAEWYEKNGVPDPGPIEWPGALEDVPSSLNATNAEDQDLLDRARQRKAAEVAITKRQRIKDRLRAELKAEIEVELREEMKNSMRGEMDGVREEIRARLVESPPEISEPAVAALPNAPEPTKPATVQEATTAYLAARREIKAVVSRENIKKSRGRPKGSKNKPKVAPAPQPVPAEG